MKTIYTLLALLFAAITANAQAQPYGVVDTADLKMTQCDFEKDANAMVLFDKAEVSYNSAASIIMFHHKRIKIFNDKGKQEASIRIEYLAHNDEQVLDLEAETINLNNHTIEYTPVDKKLIYTQLLDKEKKIIVFTFPNVKAGSVVEFKYKWRTPYPNNYPPWLFQSAIPARYSELEASFNNDYVHKTVKKVTRHFLIDTAIYIDEKNHNKGKKFIWALANINSLKAEPYMTPIRDNIQGISFQISYKFWISVFNNLLSDEDFGQQLNVSLKNEDKLLATLDSIHSVDQKIAFTLNFVKKNIAWDDYDNVYTDQGIAKAWDKKKGNSAEINLILYHLLKLAGMDVHPVVINTGGRIDEDYATIYQLDKVVDYIQVDSTKQYILDATDKYATYNELPFDLINSNGLYIDVEKKGFHFIDLQTSKPAKQLVFVQAEIKPDGSMKGTAQINSFSYIRTNALKKYKTDGEEKFKDYLRNEDNNLKISSLQVENMDVDSLPLLQNITFNLELPASDGTYIYFSPNIFTGIYTNPFLSEERYSDIDFKYLKHDMINGRYKIPAGYKADALPKNISMVMPDKSISFKRITGQQEGDIVVSYIIDFKRSFFKKEEYPDIHEFYKKMHEMLNEQIVLKKS